MNFFGTNFSNSDFQEISTALPFTMQVDEKDVVSITSNL